MAFARASGAGLCQGVFRVMGIGAVESLQAMLSAAAGKPSEQVDAAQLTLFKRLVIKELSPFFTA